MHNKNSRLYRQSQSDCLLYMPYTKYILFECVYTKYVRFSHLSHISTILQNTQTNKCFMKGKRNFF